jgi:hypothetical protein
MPRDVVVLFLMVVMMNRKQNNDVTMGRELMKM